MSYLDSNSEFLLIGVIVWHLCWTVVIEQISSVLSVGLIVFVISVNYVKYKYIEVNAKIKQAIFLRDNRLLLKAINEYNSVAQVASRFNNFF